MEVLVIDLRWFSLAGLVLDVTGALIIAHGLLSSPDARRPAFWDGDEHGLAAWFEQGRNQTIGGLLMVALGFFSQLTGVVSTFF